ncbi:ae967b63-f7c8-4a2e-874f-7c1cc538a112 [Sclerotinia trifoliorum]|uniref:Ae967b63-f7c8-4a2e-874f-7c1cc538a112 n=1 Tax=Sclerotinia trifoliorum TaxID=28548 RepID=A0A8H2VPQ5_9HELO|nr:ae967b63-f7c8-4a2e-874f-7c1cc538a112 [Sclerotinia trifoliorum]
MTACGWKHKTGCNDDIKEMALCSDYFTKLCKGEDPFQNSRASPSSNLDPASNWEIDLKDRYWIPINKKTGEHVTAEEIKEGREWEARNARRTPNERQKVFRVSRDELCVLPDG